MAPVLAPDSDGAAAKGPPWWTIDAPWVHFAPAEIERDVVVVDAAGLVFLELDGDRMRSAEELFDEYGRAMSHPGRLDKTWPALSGSLRDLRWLGEFGEFRGVLMVIDNWSQVLIDDLDELPVLIRLLNAVGGVWAERGTAGGIPVNTLVFGSGPKYTMPLTGPGGRPLRARG